MNAPRKKAKKSLENFIFFVLIILRLLIAGNIPTLNFCNNTEKIQYVNKKEQNTNSTFKTLIS